MVILKITRFTEPLRDTANIYNELMSIYKSFPLHGFPKLLLLPIVPEVDCG
jgi:hypothetical protein